ncbi:hypothetical protein BC939DRAFT_171082 [Gamsiella multidivaricata]|uniref:uncharacterized protein n=1 Tax=Gamsiella multidivaricata TaxID=101098 RepID=UPI00221FFBA6|nr:uncharacterized protein BC939DRAFT_171082 [Gamsiella multidivaricata]KAI7823048.1 hypothetical protein BC939DRAFT_171082 [Gamsiella multidivaricata]
MFAQVRANTASASAASTGSEKSDSIQSGIKTEDQQIGTTGPSSRSSNEAEETAPLSPTTSIQRRAMTEPVPAVAASTADASAASSPSTTTRIGQTIASHFTALKSSLAAASARATTLALSGGSTSSPDRSDPSTSANPNAVVVRDPVTNQSFTVLCPHMASTQVLETEIVRLQTDVSVLHERLDLLQESLKVTSQTREQERRSPRGILKLVLRQGLINAVLLLIVFAVLYKRKSPIAFAILAYIGQGRKEGEASWRALMRWSADLIRTGQRNQQNMLRAGRRNGYW